MNSKKIYRIELKEVDTIFTDCILMASVSNGGQYKPLSQIANHANWLCEKYPASGSMHTVNRIGDNILTIDKGTDNVLILTEIEVLDIDQPEITAQQAKDILSGIPTVDRYLNPQGLDDNTNHECLN